MHARPTSALWPGVPLALAAAVLFGLAAPLSKLLLGNANPWLLAGVLYLGAGVGLAVFTLLRRAAGAASAEAPLRRPDLKWLAGMVVTGGIMGPAFLMAGLSLTSASSSALLLNLEGLFTMAIAWLVLRENVDRRLLLGAGAILAGAVILSFQGGSIILDPGSLLVAAACLCWAIDNNLSRNLSAADPVMIAMIKGLVAGTTNIALALATGARLPDVATVIAGGLLGFAAVGVSLVCFMRALRHLGTARTSAYFALAPFVGTLLALLLLKEPASPQLVIAGALMGIGVYLHLAERHDHEHVHEPVEHEHLHVHDAHHQHSHDGPVTEPHSHLHRHEPLRHSHPHYPDLHHRHRHS